MTQEQLRMQMLAGIITEGQYKEKMEEVDSMGKIGNSYPAPGNEDSISNEKTGPFNQPPYKNEKWMNNWEPKFKILKSIMDEYKRRGEDPIGSFVEFGKEVAEKMNYEFWDDLQWQNPPKSGFSRKAAWAVNNVAFNSSQEKLFSPQEIIYRGGPNNSWILWGLPPA